MDIKYLLILQNLRQILGGTFDSLFLYISSIAQSPITYLILALVYWCIDKRCGELMGFNTGLACTYSAFIKWKLEIPRPWVRDARITPVEAALSSATDYSFPSGHVTRAMATYGPIGGHLWRKKKKGLASLFFVIVLLVAFSRNYLGVHTPQDVLAALVLGIVYIFVLEKIIDFVENERGSEDKKIIYDAIFAIAFAIICFIPMLFMGCIANAGFGIGFAIGYLLEKLFVGFDIEDAYIDLYSKITRFIVGALGLLFILYVGNSALCLVMESKYAGFFTQLALSLWITFVYPFFFVDKRRVKVGVVLAIVGMLLVSTAAGLVTYKRNGGFSSVTTSLVESGDYPENQTTLSDTVALIGHRGYDTVAPENTFASFEAAVKIGVDYIETDVQMTSDGKLVLFHDNDLSRVPGVSSLTIADYTLEELEAMDFGSWYSSDFAGEKIVTLDEFLDYVAGVDGLRVYLELKDLYAIKGETSPYDTTNIDPFVSGIFDAVVSHGLEDRIIFASFNYNYLQQFKALDSNCEILLNISEYGVDLPQIYPADYYGLFTDVISKEVVDAIHAAGYKAFTWNADTVDAINMVLDYGVDGICTNYPDLASILIHDEYSVLSDNYINSFVAPALYGATGEAYSEYVYQGLAVAGDYILVSAYSNAGNNSILYVLDLNGNLVNIVDLGFVAHVGGIAYDDNRGLLWCTGADGEVYGLGAEEILTGSYVGDIWYSFNAGLVNASGGRVASFLNIYNDKLYVGSYFEGADGELRAFAIDDILEYCSSDIASDLGEDEIAVPANYESFVIPERIQSVAFRADERGGVTMYMTQGYDMNDAYMLTVSYTDGRTDYSDVEYRYLLPEGPEEICVTDSGLYLLFESATKNYEDSVRTPNDRIWILQP